jgi:hypothetical protein
MPAAFPTSVKVFTTKTNLVDIVEDTDMNSVQAEIFAIETALGPGVQASTVYTTATTVKQRLGFVEADASTAAGYFGEGGTVTQSQVVGLVAALAELTSLSVFDSYEATVTAALNTLASDVTATLAVQTASWGGWLHFAKLNVGGDATVIPTSTSWQNALMSNPLPLTGSGVGDTPYDNAGYGGYSYYPSYYDYPGSGYYPLASSLASGLPGPTVPVCGLPIGIAGSDPSAIWALSATVEWGRDTPTGYSTGVRIQQTWVNSSGTREYVTLASHIMDVDNDTYVASGGFDAGQGTRAVSWTGRLDPSAGGSATGLSHVIVQVFQNSGQSQEILIEGEGTSHFTATRIPFSLATRYGSGGVGYAATDITV